MLKCPSCNKSNFALHKDESDSSLYKAYCDTCNMWLNAKITISKHGNICSSCDSRETFPSHKPCIDCSLCEFLDYPTKYSIKGDAG